MLALCIAQVKLAHLIKSVLNTHAELGKCMLCPRACGVNRNAGQTGVCKAGAQVQVARAALHFWEEPPISGTNGSGTIFLSHCALRCVYCQNHEIAHEGFGKVVSENELAKMCLNLQSQGALNINFVTPTHYAPQIRSAINIARKAGLSLPIVWNTAGYETADAICANNGFVDIYLTDFKYASSALAKNFSAAPNYPSTALAAIEAMLAQVGSLAFDTHAKNERMTRGVVVRHMLLPGCLEDSKRVVKTLWQHFGESVALSLMNQYTPVLATQAQKGSVWAQKRLQQFPELANTVSNGEYEQLLDYADGLGIENYFWQSGGTCSESFIPEFNLSEL